MRHLKIKTKILLGLGVLGTMFLMFLLVVQWSAMQMVSNQNIERDLQLPAGLGLQEAQAGFQRLIKRYNDAVLTQDKASIGQSAQDTQTILDILSAVEQKTSYSMQRQQQVQQLRERIAMEEPQARETYSAMLSSQDNLDTGLQAAAAGIARQHQEIEAGLKQVSADVIADFTARMADSTTLSAHQTQFGWLMGVLTLLFGMITLVVVDRQVSHPLGELARRMEDIANGEGDLTQRLQQDNNLNDEIGQASRWFNTFMDKMQDVILQVAESSEHLTRATGEIAGSAERLADESGRQREHVHSIAVAMQQMTESVGQISNSASRAAGSVTDAGVMAQQGGVTANAATTAIHLMQESTTETGLRIEQVGKSANEIGRIVGVIDKIAARTNLLALNAAIEAARAGEHGRGFAVVAGEVRELAVRTISATAEITQMIAAIQTEAKGAVNAVRSGSECVGAAVNDVTQASDALQKIIRSAEHVQTIVTQIAGATQEQSTTAAEVNRGMDEIAGMAEKSAVAAAESSAGCGRLVELARGLNNLVGMFKVSRQSQKSGTDLRKPIGVTKPLPVKKLVA